MYKDPERIHGPKDHMLGRGRNRQNHEGSGDILLSTEINT